MKRAVLGAALGEDAHVTGVMSFLRLAEAMGWKTIYLGPAVSVEALISQIRKHDPELIAVSYRLTPETGEALLKQLMQAVRKAGFDKKRYVFGGTPPLAEKARQFGFFERCFSGEEPMDDVIAYLKGELWQGTTEKDFPQTFVERLKKPFPLIRHHFGQPTVEETIEGIREIAEARVLDVISLGIDQDAQENFYHPERQDLRRICQPLRRPGASAHL